MAIEYYNQSGFNKDTNVSQSALNALDPELGGSPQNFLNFFLQVKIETPSMEKGNLFAEWLDKPNEFVVAELDKPTEQMAKFTEEFYNLYFKELKKEIPDPNFIEYCKMPIEFDLADSFEIHKIYESFFSKKAEEKDFQLLLRAVFYSRREAQVDKRLKNPTILSKFQTECLPYLRFLQQAGNRIILDRQTKTSLSNMQSSVTTHPIASKLITAPGVEKEKEFYWTETYNTLIINRKARIDNIRVDYVNKIVWIIDHKSTSKPVALFPEQSFKKYKLGRQLVSYEEAFFKSNKLDYNGWTINLINIVTQSIEPYTTQVFQMSVKNIFENRNDLNKIKDRLIYHISNNMWELTMEEHKYGIIEI